MNVKQFGWGAAIMMALAASRAPFQWRLRLGYEGPYNGNKKSGAVGSKARRRARKRQRQARRIQQRVARGGR